MAKRLEINITAIVPEDNEELGHDAIIASRDGADSIVEALKKLGLIDVARKSNLVKGKSKGTVASGEANIRAVPKDPVDPRPEAEDDAAD